MIAGSKPNFPQPTLGKAKQTKKNNVLIKEEVDITNQVYDNYYRRQIE